MNSKVFMILRILLGLFVLVFGANKFLHFLPPPEMGEAAMNYFGALSSTHTMTVVAIVEVLAGLALIFNKFGALMSVILMSVSFNALLFHITLEPGGSGPAAVLLLLNVIMLIGYKDKYQEMLKG